MKLKKLNCVVLIWTVGKDVRIIGVFKNTKEAQHYQKWLGDERQERYSIQRASRFIYSKEEENKWEAMEKEYMKEI